jgi:hypothetical protein
LAFYAASASGDVVVYQPIGSLSLNIVSIGASQTSSLPAPYVPANPAAIRLSIPAVDFRGRSRIAYMTGELTTRPATQRRVSSSIGRGHEHADYRRRADQRDHRWLGGGSRLALRRTELAACHRLRRGYAVVTRGGD